MNRVSAPQSRCRFAIVRHDITPPIGIFHRMWGAAMHDQATGIHRPLLATLLWLAPLDSTESESSSARIIISLDHCILDTAEIAAMRQAIEQVTGVPSSHVLLTLTHTHGSGWMSRQRAESPGGDRIGPYLDSLRDTVVSLARDASHRLQPATIVYGSGHCDLAGYRDFFDQERGHAVCGFDPNGQADDLVVVARIVDEGDRTLATIVNYACHPTTLAWDNTLISPDWVGAMRDTVESQTEGICLFLQGASGDLGPREGFVGDVTVADRNGRQLGFAALATLESLPASGTAFVYQGPRLSGTWIGVWSHERVAADELSTHARWCWKDFTVNLPYRRDLPTIAQTQLDRDQWLQRENEARARGDEHTVRTCRAHAEQMTRQLTRLLALGESDYCRFPVTIGSFGDALWIFTAGELYQVFQQTLRARFAPRPVVVTTLTGDWQPGYIPPAAKFGYGIYQEVIAATSPGSLELLIEEVSRQIRSMIS